MSLILEGPKNDNGFNQAAYVGVQKAVESSPNLELASVLENRPSVEQDVEAIETVAPTSDIVVGASANFGPAYDAVAASFPETQFLTLGGYPSKFQKNVQSLTFDRVASYVTGVISAKLTKSDIVGFIGGMDIPPVDSSMKGFVAGVKSVNPGVKVLTNITGDFNDIAKTKAAASAMLAEGADVLMPYVGGGIAGAYAAAEESGNLVPMFKLDVLDCTTYPNMIGANIGDNTEAANLLLTAASKEELKPEGVTIFAGLQDPKLQRVQLCPKYEKDAELVKAAEEARKGIDDGSIKMPEGVLNPRPPYPYREGFEGPVQNEGSAE